MSILINMEMPKNCCECIISQTHALNGELVYQCPFTGYFNSRVVTSQRRMNDCPLVPVPPHGRLIDASVLDKMTMWDTNREYDKGWNSAVRMAQERVADAPTIIEAEEDDDE